MRVRSECIHLVALSGAINASGKESDKDERKLAFTLKALETADPFVKKKTTAGSVVLFVNQQRCVEKGVVLSAIA